MGVLALLALACASSTAAAHEESGGDGLLHDHADPVWSFGTEELGRLPAEPVPGQAALRRSAAVSAAGGCAPVDRTSDDAGRALYPGTTPTIKVVYAHPSDVPNRFGRYAPVIDAGARGAGAIVANASGNTRALRFDLGTSQGAECLDIQRVSLPLTAISYTAAPSTAFTLIRTQVQAQLGPQPSARNYLVYADGVDLEGIAGEAQIWGDDSYEGTRHGRGGLFAVLYGSGGTDFFGSAVNYGAGVTSRNHIEYALHEMGHNLGAVQRSSPNHTNRYHCRDEWDILCYDDDGSSGLATFISCGGDSYSSASEAWDCNRDDYFNPSPAVGSYLSSHWNLYRSVFLCQVSACGAGWASGPADRRPPETLLLKAPKRTTRKRRITFRFASDEAGSNFECRVDRRAYRSCRSPLTLRKVKRGHHRFSVRARDPAGNLDPTPAAARFRARRR